MAPFAVSLPVAVRRSIQALQFRTNAPARSVSLHRHLPSVEGQPALPKDAVDVLQQRIDRTRAPRRVRHGPAVWAEAYLCFLLRLLPEIHDGLVRDRHA